MDHYVIMSTADQSDPAGQTDLKMAGLRDEMARYQPEIVKALNAQVIHDLGFNWPFFEKNTLQPLENKINQRDKLIEYVAIPIILFICTFEISHILIAACFFL